MKPCPAPRPANGQATAGRSRRIGRAPAGILLSLLLAGGCHRAQFRAPAAEEGPLPMYIRLQVQVIGLRETAIPPDAPFPAPGFRFKEDRVLPVQEPDTVAGAEVTAEQFQRWMAALPKWGAPTVYLQQAFIVGPNFHVGAANSQEKRYCSNWRIDAEAATPQFASIAPGFKADLLPLIVAGSPDLLVSADVRILPCDLEPFKASEGFAPPAAPKLDRLSGKSPPPKPVLGADRGLAPLMVQLPRQTVLQLATSAPVRPGRTIVLAHYVKQYMAPVPIPLRGAGTRSLIAASPFDHAPALRSSAAPAGGEVSAGEEEQGRPEGKRPGGEPPGRMQPVREHVFYLVSAERSQEQPKSDIPMVAEVLPRYALSLTWDQWEPAGPGASSGPAGVPSAQPLTAKGDLAEILKAAEGMRNSPQAVSQTFSVATTVKKPLRVEAVEDRSYVAGIHRDSEEATSPRTFVINQASAGMWLETQLEPTAGGFSAALQGRFAGPVRWDERIVIVPSARRKPDSSSGRGAKPAPGPHSGEAPVAAVASGTEEYHFQTASQHFAEINSPLELLPGETRVLPLTWRASGDAPPDKQARIATVSLKRLPDADQKKESVSGEAPAQEGAVKGAPARP